MNPKKNSGRRISVLRDNAGADGGFTLIEVTIALAILAAGLVTLLAGLNAGVLFSDRDRDYTIASFLAQEKMTELERDPEKISSGFSDDGQFEDEFERFSYRIEIVPDENAQALADMVQISFEPLKATVTVTWQYKEVERKYTLEEIFFAQVVTTGL